MGLYSAADAGDRRWRRELAEKVQKRCLLCSCIVLSYLLSHPHPPNLTHPHPHPTPRAGGRSAGRTGRRGKGGGGAGGLCPAILKKQLFYHLWDLVSHGIGRPIVGSSGTRAKISFKSGFKIPTEKLLNLFTCPWKNANVKCSQRADSPRDLVRPASSPPDQPFFFPTFLQHGDLAADSERRGGGLCRPAWES